MFHVERLSVLLSTLVLTLAMTAQTQQHSKNQSVQTGKAHEPKCATQYILSHQFPNLPDDVFVPQQPTGPKAETARYKDVEVPMNRTITVIGDQFCRFDKFPESATANLPNIFKVTKVEAHGPYLATVHVAAPPATHVYVAPHKKKK